MSIVSIFKSAMRADPQAGAVLIDLAVYDYLGDLAKAAEVDLVKMHSIVALDRIQKAKRELGRQYVDSLVSKGQYPDDSVHEMAEQLAGIESFISKAAGARQEEWNDTHGGTRTRQVRRDRLGQFARAIDAAPVDLAEVDERPKSGGSKVGYAPRVRTAIENHGGDITKIDEARTAKLQQLQGDYEAAVKVAREFDKVFHGAKGVDVEMTFMSAQAGGGKKMKTKTFSLEDFDSKTGKFPDGADWGSGDSLVLMAVKPALNAPEKTAKQIGAYNLLGDAGGTAMASLMAMEPEKIQGLADSLGMDTAPDQTKLTRFFNQLTTGGDVLRNVQGGEKLGALAVFAGSIGPQAEQVLGPYAQRAAYRYRGTETTPPKRLMQAFNAPDMKGIDAAAETLEYKGFTDPASITDKIAQTAASSGKDGMGLRGDSLKMQTRADLASAELATMLPKDPMLARLSELSGQVLPSQGFLIDRKGKIVSQSVGFTDDHYLPFDLKNLHQLRGGQYARTRVSGGLTGEDIYTAVHMGARQVQVISSSGVYTLEMARDFRGMRGNSDKARSMYDRYLKILDAVDTSNEYLLDISPREKNRIKDDVARLGLSDGDAKKLSNERIDQARASQTSVTAEEEEAIHAKVMQDMGLTSESQLRGSIARNFEDNYTDALDEARATKANQLRLNGEGYAVALETLRQQFPYFIKRVEYRPLNDFVAATGLKGQGVPMGRSFAKDSGYALPGSLRAQGVRSGFYRTGSLQPGAKPRQGQPEAAGAATAAVAVVGGGGAGATDAAPETEAAPVADAKTAMSGRLTDKAPQFRTERENLSSRLATEIAKTTVFNEGLDGQSFSQVKHSQDTAAQWLITRKAPELQKVLTGPDMMHAAMVLSNRDVVKRAFETVAFDAAGKGADFWNQGGSVGDETVKPGDIDASINWVADTAQTIADLAILEHPFAAGQGNVWHGANDDVIVPQESKATQQIQTTRQLKDFEEHNVDAWGDAKTLMVSGNRYRMLGEMGANVKSGLKAAAKVRDMKGSIGFNESNAKILDSGGVDTLVAYIAAREGDPASLASARLVLEDLTEDGEFDPSGKELVTFLHQQKPEETAARLQNAWSLAMTARVVGILDGGDYNPKGDRRLMKSAHSAPRMLVLDRSDEMSKALALAMSVMNHPAGKGRLIPTLRASRLSD